VTAPPLERGGRWWLCAAVASVAIGANILVWAFVRRERTLHSWDALQYWNLAAELSGALRRDPLLALGQVLGSLRTDDYNLLPALPPALLMTVLGTSRLTYLLCLTNLYVLPAILCMALLARRIARQLRVAPATPIVAALYLGLCPALWMGVLQGCPDVGGLLLVCPALGLLLDRPLRDQPHRSLALLGLLLALLVLFRRWYGYWVASFLAIAAADTLWATWRGDRRWRAWTSSLGRLLLLAASLAAVLLVAAWPQPRTMLITDYAAQYVAYRPRGGGGGSLAANLRKLWCVYGGAVSLGVLGALLWGFVRRARRRVTLVVGSQLLLALVLFARTNDLGSPQHQCLVLASMVVLLTLSINDGLASGSGVARRAAAVGAGGLVLLGGLGTLWVFWPPVERDCATPCPAPTTCAQRVWNGIVSGACFRPQRRGDIAELERLVAALPPLLAPADRLYVLASGTLFNGEMVRLAHLSLGPAVDLSRRTARTHEVDRRDGFPSRLLDTDLVLVADPVQLHLRAEEQSVVSIPAGHLLSGRGVGAAFDRLSPLFRLAHGVRVHLFRRRRAPTPAEIQVLSEELRQAHPDTPFVYQPPGGHVARP
jgi:hypothetical protein